MTLISAKKFAKLDCPDCICLQNQYQNIFVTLSTQSEILYQKYVWWHVIRLIILLDLLKGFLEYGNFSVIFY